MAIEATDASGAALDAARDAGSIVVSEPVIAEIAPRFGPLRELARFLDDVGGEIVRCSIEALCAAGERWRTYIAARSRQLECAECGDRRVIRCTRCGSAMSAGQHIIADFLVGSARVVAR